MTLTFDLPASVEQTYRAEARARGLAVDDLVREVLISNRPVPLTAIEQGLGLFSSAEDSALLDEAVAIAMESRHQPSNRI